MRFAQDVDPKRLGVRRRTVGRSIVNDNNCLHVNGLRSNSCYCTRNELRSVIRGNDNANWKLGAHVRGCISAYRLIRTAGKFAQLVDVS